MIVGIIGMNRSGSTVLSMVLNGLPGVTSLGEAHHFVNRPDWACCTSCGPDNCPVITPEVRKEAEVVARDNPSGLYKYLQGITGGVLVVSDKLPNIYQRHTSIPDLGLLVIKDPRAAVWSNVQVARKVKKRFDNLSPPTDAEVEYAIRMLHGYRGIMNWCDESVPGWGSVLVDDLVERPEKTLAALASFCETEPDPAALRFWENPQHQVAGNTAVRTQAGPMAGAIRKDERWRDVLTDGQQAMVNDDPQIREIYRRARTSCVVGDP